jgi:DUF4097 and DUF4098 domain-containing protein YvlB
MKRVLWTATVLFSLVAARAGAQTTIDETHSAAEHGIVSIRNVSGFVHVTGWSQKNVRVKGTLGPGVKRLNFEREEDRTRIEVEVPDHIHDGKVNGKSIEAQLEISVPEGSAVRVDGVNIEIGVGGVNGELELQSVNGSVTVSGEPDEVKVSTVNGTITLNTGARKTHLETVNGSIEVTGGKGELEAACVNGHIEVRDGTFDEASCSTVSGDTVWRATLASRSSLSLETHSGSITLELPRSTSAEFDVTTFSGKIANGLGPEAKRSSEYGPGYELHFDLGSGASKIDVSSFSGDVTIRAR